MLVKNDYNAILETILHGPLLFLQSYKQRHGQSLLWDIFLKMCA